MAEKPLSPWEVLGSREVFSAPPWLRVLSQEVRLPDGRVIPDFYRVEAPDFAVVCASRPGGEVAVLRQYKPAAGRVVHCLPAGYLDPGEPPLEGARRELREETGLASREWRHLLSLPVAADRGYGTCHLFLAGEALPQTAPVRDSSEEAELLWLTPGRALALAAGGEPFTLSALTLLALACHPAFAGAGEPPGR